MFRKIRLSLAIALAVAGSAAAQDQDRPASSSGGSVPITYVGSHGRIGLGIDQDGHVLGELLGIAGDNGERAFAGEAYFGERDAGGVKFGYQWLWDGATRLDTIQHPDAVTVAKVFGAWDQNRFRDRKATLGLGFERERGEFDIYYSRGLTGARLLHSDSASSRTTLTGVENGRPYEQQIVTDVLTEQFERAYQHGLGMRFSRFFDQSLLRLRAGVDYERGSALLDNDHASQASLTLGADKYFEGSGHSLALEVSQHRKDGPFDRPAFGGQRERTSATLVWRYGFGQSFRPVRAYRNVEVALPPDAPQVVRNEVQIASQELFEFDRAELTDAAQAQLTGLLDTLKNRRVGKVEIVGYTCDLGSEPYNQALSERRANAVRDWLQAQGVPAEDLQASGRGESQPRYPNDSESHRAGNRRIELSFLTVEETQLAAPPQVGWKREPVPTPAAWIERALRSLPAHKRTVDTYRAQRVSKTVQEGPKVFINRPPQAADDATTTPIDTAVVVAVLANDRDQDNDTLSVQSVTSPANGATVLNPDGSVGYTPRAGFSGNDTFQYTISDGKGGTATATVNVTVQPPLNRAPLAVNDSVTVMVDDPPTVIALLSNDSDPDGDSLQIPSITGLTPDAGTAVLNADGTVTYTPNGLYVGLVTFSYTLVDGRGGTSTAVVTITVETIIN